MMGPVVEEWIRKCILRIFWENCLFSKVSLPQWKMSGYNRIIVHQNQNYIWFRRIILVLNIFLTIL
jgi:hypothetical protein